MVNETEYIMDRFEIQDDLIKCDFCKFREDRTDRDYPCSKCIENENHD